MAVGFNSKIMPGTNCVVCYYAYTGSGADTFTCEDASNSGYSGPVAFSTQDFISGVTTVSNAIDTTTADASSLSVSFTRPLNPTTGDTEDDTIDFGDMNVIWAYGPYSGGAVTEHVDRGSDSFTVESAINFGVSCLLILSLI